MVNLAGNLSFKVLLFQFLSNFSWRPSKLHIFLFFRKGIAICEHYLKFSFQALQYGFHNESIAP